MANLNITGKLNIGGSIEGCGVVPIGTIIAFAGVNTPIGWLFCNGGTFDKTEYPQLFTVLGGNSLPNLSDGRFLEGASVPKTFKSAGLPNIEGKVQDILIDDGVEIIKGSGAFNLSTGQREGKTWSSYNRTGTKQLNFNANSANTLYGSSSTVQPKSYTVRFLIKAK